MMQILYAQKASTVEGQVDLMVVANVVVNVILPSVVDSVFGPRQVAGTAASRGIYL
jgi:hypothetical protein